MSTKARITVNQHALEQLVGKKIRLNKPLRYCNVKDWPEYDEWSNKVNNLPIDMCVIKDGLYFKKNVWLPVGFSAYTEYPTLGVDALDTCLAEGYYFMAEVESE